MTDKLYTQSDMEALRERCAKVAEEYPSACLDCITEKRIADEIRALPLHPEGQKP